MWFTRVSIANPANHIPLPTPPRGFAFPTASGRFSSGAAGKASGVLAADGKAEHYFEGGATVVGVGTALHLLIAGADAVATKFRLP